MVKCYWCLPRTQQPSPIWKPFADDMVIVCVRASGRALAYSHWQTQPLWGGDMIDTMKKWYDRYLTREDSVVLLMVIVSTFLSLWLLGDVLAPILIAIVIAYLMQGAADTLKTWGLSPALSLTVSVLLFIGAFIAFTVGLAPLVWGQLEGLVREVPQMTQQVQSLLNSLFERYPSLVDSTQLNELLSSLQATAASMGQRIVGFGLSSIPGVLTFAIYLVLIPLLVFFFVKDQEQIMAWVLSFLPKDRSALDDIGRQMNLQIAKYVRGKGIEIVIVGLVSYVAFAWFDLNYTALLALLVGLSVIVPYVGATLVTVPVVLVALLQFGITTDFYWVVGLYLVIQILDGNVLVPILFSEAVDLHPVAIIIAILVFGGLWGVWGVFFAIPLATVVNVLLVSWPEASSGAE